MPVKRLCSSGGGLPQQGRDRLLGVPAPPQQGKVSSARVLEFCSGPALARLCAGESCYISAPPFRSGKRQSLQQTSLQRVIGRAEPRRMAASASVEMAQPQTEQVGLYRVS